MCGIKQILDEENHYVKNKPHTFAEIGGSSHRDKTHLQVQHGKHILKKRTAMKTMEKEFGIP